MAAQQQRSSKLLTAAAALLLLLLLAAPAAAAAAGCPASAAAGEPGCASCGQCFSHPAADPAAVVLELANYEPATDETTFQLTVHVPSGCAYASLSLKLRPGLAGLPAARGAAPPPGRGIAGPPAVRRGCDAATGLQASLVWDLSDAGADEHGNLAAPLVLRGQWELEDVFAPADGHRLADGAGHALALHGGDALVAVLVHEEDARSCGAPRCSHALVPHRQVAVGRLRGGGGGAAAADAPAGLRPVMVVASAAAEGEDADYGADYDLAEEAEAARDDDGAAYDEDVATE